jgi:hypothetical protein
MLTIGITSDGRTLIPGLFTAIGRRLTEIVSAWIAFTQPQMVVDGTTEFVGSDAVSANKAIENALRTPKLRVNLSLVPLKNGEISQIRVDVAQLESSFGIREAEVYVAYALNRAESQVSAGENAGHKLAHVSVVKRIAKIGEIKSGAKFSSTFQLDHASGINAKNGRIIVFVQERHQGRIIGVALARLSIS